MFRNTYLDFITSFNNLVLLGDFNFSDVNWESLNVSSPLSNKFCDVIFDLNFIKLIDQPIHIAGNILDLILTKIPDSIFNIHINDNPLLPIPSDHYTTTFNISTSSVPSKTKPGNTLHFSKGDYEGLCYFLGSIDFSPCYQTEDIEFIWSYLSKDAMNIFIPVVPIHYNKQPAWFNSDIQYHINCFRTLGRKLNKHPTNNNQTNNSSNLHQEKISSAKDNYV